VLEQALVAARAIEHEESRAQALEALAPQLTGPLLEQALAAAQAIKDEKNRARVLGALAPQVAESWRPQVLEQALVVVRAIKDEMDRTEMLGALAPQLTGILFEEAVEAALTIQNFSGRVQALTGFLPTTTEYHWARGCLQQALLDTFSPVQPLSREEVLDSLSTSLFQPPILSPDALGIIALYLVEICQGWHWL
jgi:hypothetical protein